MKEDSFKEFVLDQMRDMGKVDCRAMFGGYGLYEKATFFGIIYQGSLYFKTDPLTITPYLTNGMKPFRPNNKMTLKTYYEVPVDVIEDSDQLTDWAKKAIRCQKQKKSLRNR